MSILEGFPDAPTVDERQKQTEVDGQPVASLLESYRSKRSAWIAEAELLAQLRDQVRSAADNETLEIVAKARQDVRDVVATARRELLVLTEQLRASLGDSEPAPRAVEALGGGAWLAAAVSPAATGSSDVHPTFTIVQNELAQPAATGPRPSQSTAEPDDDWAEFDLLLSETSDHKLRR